MLTQIRCKLVTACGCVCSFGVPLFVSFLSLLFCTVPSDSPWGIAAFSDILSPFPHYFCLSACYLCLDEITAVRRVERDCVASLTALWLCLAVSSSPLWGARRAQLAAQNSPFSWRVVERKINTHPDYINLTAAVASYASRVGKTQPYTPHNLVCSPEKYSLVSDYL